MLPSVLITRPLALSRLATSGPHLVICLTFSSVITRGAAWPAQRVTTQDKARILPLRGWPPAAWLWWVQSGLACSKPTERPWVAWRGHNSNTSA